MQCTDIIQRTNRSRPVVIWMKESCPFSRRARLQIERTMTEVGLTPLDKYMNVILLDDPKQEHDFRNVDRVMTELQNISTDGARTVPRIFMNGVFYGDSNTINNDCQYSTLRENLLQLK